MFQPTARTMLAGQWEFRALPEGNRETQWSTVPELDKESRNWMTLRTKPGTVGPDSTEGNGPSWTYRLKTSF